MTQASSGARRIAIIGCGFIGGIHSLVLWGLRRAGVTRDAVVAACDGDPERARLCALFHEAPVATSDPEEAMRVADTVWICTPTATHLDLVRAAGRNGLAVYCEKPLAPTFDQATQVAAAASGAPLQVGLVLRHSPVLQAMADKARFGGLGKVMSVVLRDDQYFPIQGLYASTWRGDVSVCGGGTLIEHSIHDLDTLVWLAGPVCSIGAHTANFAGHQGVEDVAVATLVHESGTTSSLTSVWHQVLSRPSTRRFEIFCENGVLWTDDEHAGPAWLQAGDDIAPLEPDAPSAAEGKVSRLLGLPAEFQAPLSLYVRADLAFLQSLHAGSRPHPGADLALEAHRLVDAAYRSARSEVVPLEHA